MDYEICDIKISIGGSYEEGLLSEFTRAAVDISGSLVSIEIKNDARPYLDMLGEDFGIESLHILRSKSNLFSWLDAQDGEKPTLVVGSDNPESAILYSKKSAAKSLILNMLMVAFLPVVARNNGLLFHASLVEYEGRAVAFTASSGTGKSTQADLWHEHLGAEIMNGDRAFVRRFDAEWRAYGSPWAGSSPYIKNVKAPLAGIVVLKQAPENRIRRLNAAEVMAYLYNNVRYPFWDEEATAASLETLDTLIREIPIFLLECRPDEEAVCITRDAIFGK